MATALAQQAPPTPLASSATRDSTDIIGTPCAVAALSFRPFLLFVRERPLPTSSFVFVGEGGVGTVFSVGFGAVSAAASDTCASAASSCPTKYLPVTPTAPCSPSGVPVDPAHTTAARHDAAAVSTAARRSPSTVPSVAEGAQHLAAAVRLPRRHQRSPGLPWRQRRPPSSRARLPG